jgi:peptidoglycan hydrolase-like protein with peptidoglycan-binding domain
VPRRRRNQIVDFDDVGRLAAAIARHPREFVGIVMGTAAIFAIIINALFLQHGPHSAPIFTTRTALSADERVVLPRPRVVEPAATPATTPARPPAQIVTDIQRELSRKGFYDGSPDGAWGAKTDAAARDFVQAAGLRVNVEASENLLRAVIGSKVQAPRQPVAPARKDPIAELLAPTKQVLAVQRALADFGYGQIKPTGVFDPATQAAIEKFERDRKLPVTGQMTDLVVRELAAMTGRPLE